MRVPESAAAGSQLIHVNRATEPESILPHISSAALHHNAMFTQPQRLRRLAVYVLLVWLFGLGSGIVNACVVQMQLDDSATLLAQHEHEEATVDALHCHDGDAQHESDANHPACERLCDSPSAVPQTEKLQSNPLSGFLMAAAPLPSFTFQIHSDPGAILPGEHLRWRTDVPISIAFLRLSL